MGAIGGVSVIVTLSIGLGAAPSGGGGTLHAVPRMSTATTTLLFCASTLAEQDFVTVRLASKLTCGHIAETGPSLIDCGPPGDAAAVTNALLAGGLGVDGPAV